jgi:hypothetical protein
VIATMSGFLVQLPVFCLFTLAPHLFGIDLKELLKLFCSLGSLQSPHIGIKYGRVVRIAPMRKTEQQSFLLSQRQRWGREAGRLSLSRRRHVTWTPHHNPRGRSPRHRGRFLRSQIRSCRMARLDTRRTTQICGRMPVLMNRDGDDQAHRTSPQERDRWTPEPSGGWHLANPHPVKRIEDTALHASRRLCIAQPIEQSFDRCVSIFHRDSSSPSSRSPDFLSRLVALPVFMRLSSAKGAHAAQSSAAWREIRSRSRALARDSRARTADSLRPSTVAISAVPNSSMAESNNTWRSAFGNLSISRRTA